VCMRVCECNCESMKRG